MTSAVAKRSSDLRAQELFHPGRSHYGSTVMTSTPVASCRSPVDPPRAPQEQEITQPYRSCQALLISEEPAVRTSSEIHASMATHVPNTNGIRASHQMSYGSRLH